MRKNCLSVACVVGIYRHRINEPKRNVDLTNYAGEKVTKRFDSQAIHHNNNDSLIGL